MKNVTFVSALFDIDRVDGRKWDQYLKWFDVTLKLRVPMLLFITEDLQEFVDEEEEIFLQRQFILHQKKYLIII
jgi:hypothetical protein